MNDRRFKYEGWLYGLAFLLALSLRLVKLGALPPSDAEATAALQALQLTQGLKPALAPHPFYILFTTPLFFLFDGGTNFLARFLPALVGSALVFVPFLFQGRLKPRPGLILAFFIALDPGLMTLSRQAAGSIFSITFFLFAWGFWINNRTQLAGVFAALALLSGPSIWAGLLVLAIAWAINQGMGALTPKEELTSEEETTSETPASTPTQASSPLAPDSAGNPNPQSQISNQQLAISNLQSPITSLLRPAIIPFLATFLIVGSLLFVVPTGLGAAFASLPEYIRGWGVSSGVPSSRIFASLLIYQPLAVFLALLAIVRGWMRGSRRIIPLSIWLLVAALLTVFYPSHQVSDLGWALIPLNVLAALELARHLGVPREDRSEVIGVVALVLFIIAFAWLDLAGLVWSPTPSPQGNLRVWLFFGSLLLLAVSILLVGMGWSTRVAQYGAVYGLAIALGIFGLGGGLGSIGLRGQAYPEFWWPPSYPAQADLLMNTVNDLSQWSTGEPESVPVVISNIESPALEWALRDHEIKRVSALDPSESAPLIITPLEAAPVLSSGYRGQDFLWRQSPSWHVADSPTWIKWLVLREMPQDTEYIILWARDDLFLDTSGPSTP
ncbi:MAG: hypothetical protein AB1649_20015 [Chloroflexota bacterium]